MSWFSSLRGNVTVSITAADVPGTLDAFLQQNIPVSRWDMVTEWEAVLTFPAEYDSRAREICERRGDILKPVAEKGIFPKGRQLLRRPVLVLGAMLYVLASLYLPSRVFFLRVEGNETVPTRQILEAAEGCGLVFGAKRREVRSERMKNALLEAMPQLQWAGVNTNGCVATISVREREREENPEERNALGHIIARRDGIISSCQATRGNLLCAPGQAVGEGDILISGFTDCGLSIRAEQAQGEIFALTHRELKVIAPDCYLRTVEAGESRKKISLLIGKKRINLWKDSGFWDATCDRMYEEKYITLPGGFQLPFGWSVERCRHRELREMQTDPELLRELLECAGESYLRRQMIAGTIRKSDLFFEEGEGIGEMTGQYSCEEMIGISQRFEIGEVHGENH